MNLTYILGLTLLHFLWQGTLVAMLLYAVNAGLRKSSAASRYTAACCALLLMAICALATFIRLNSVPSYAIDNATQAAIATNAPLATAVAVPMRSGGVAVQIANLLPWLVYFWVAGVLVLTLRSLGGWMLVQRFKRRSAAPATEEWQQRMIALARRLRISRPIRLCESVMAEVPAVIGWIRPMVLLPASALSGLTAEQLEALLAHELAHIRRHDYLVNLLQTCVETLLFYHPAVWWVAHRIRSERENCCDDLAVSVCGDALGYARALTQMEQLRCGVPRLAMAANRGSLLLRIQRIIPGLPVSQPTRNASTSWISIIAIALLLSAAWVSPRLARSTTVAAQEPAPPSPEAAPAVGVIAPSSLAHVAPMIHAPKTAPTAIPRELATPQPVPQAGSGSGKQGYMEEMDKAGYHNLSVDMLIALKTHGVNAEYVQQIHAAGYEPTVEQLLALKIHGVTGPYINDLKSQGWKLDINQILACKIHDVDSLAVQKMSALGYKLDANQALAMKIHGLTPELASKARELGLGTPTFEQLLAMKIHGADAEWISGMKQTGIKDLDLDKLLALKIHGSNPAEIKELQSLGFKDLSANQVIETRIFGVTPDFIRETRKRGMKDLTLEQIVKLKQFGILDRESN